MKLIKKLLRKIGSSLAVIRRSYEKSRGDMLMEQKSSNSADVFFITGFDKSGTTWMMKMLNSYPYASCKGSGQFFNFYDDSTPYLSNKSGYQYLVEKVSESKWFLRSAEKVWLSKKSIALNYVELVISALRAHKKPNESMIGDKSTCQDVGLLTNYFTQSKVIVMLRDPRDICVSFAYHLTNRGSTGKLTEMGAVDSEFAIQIATAWSKYTEGFASYLKNDRVLLIKYEDMLMEPEKGLTKVLAFIGLSNSKEIVRKIVEANSFERMTMGRKPGEEDPSSFFRKGVAGDWQNKLSTDQVNHIEKICFVMMNRFGYELSSSLVI